MKTQNPCIKNITKQGFYKHIGIILKLQGSSKTHGDWCCKKLAKIPKWHFTEVRSFSISIGWLEMKRSKRVRRSSQPLGWSSELLREGFEIPNFVLCFFFWPKRKSLIYGIWKVEWNWNPLKQTRDLDIQWHWNPCKQTAS